MQPPRSLLARLRAARPLTARFATLAAALGAALLLWHAGRDVAPGTEGVAASPIYASGVPRSAAPTAAAATPAVAAVVAAVQPASIATLQVIVGRHDTLDRIFRRMALDPADLAAIRQLPGIRQSLDFLKPGDAIQVRHREGAVQELTRKVSDTKTLEVVRDTAGFEAKVLDNPVETRVRTATARIDSSLFQAAEAAGISDTMALRLAEVFAWDIDFVLDIREGDRFTAVYEQVWQDGKYLRDGELLAAEFVNDGRVYRAVRYVNEAGVAGYYSPSGQPMRKAFLRAPVEFTRVSSVFNPHRLHPILNLIRGHMGTDYAAPTGTPVHAAGDGRVAFAGRRGGYGNAVVLAHGNDVSTLYGHLSHFARGLRIGERVQQGQVIAYVGMTGLATGPHLHYEYLVRGVHLDPLKVRLPGAEPLHAGALEHFRSASARWLARLDPTPAAIDARLAAAAVLAPAGASTGGLRRAPFANPAEALAPLDTAALLGADPAPALAGLPQNLAFEAAPSPRPLLF